MTTTAACVCSRPAARSTAFTTAGAQRTAAPQRLRYSDADRKLARLFGLEGETWMRHANPLSVWTRFTVLPLLAVAIWSRDWIGWWSLVRSRSPSSG